MTAFCPCAYVVDGKWCERYARIHLHLAPLSFDTDKSRFAPIALKRYFYDQFLYAMSYTKDQVKLGYII